jgi:hypothetical protein
MLTAAQIIPFLTHEDPEIRTFARRYLTTAHDPAPATAEDFWNAADKTPEELGAFMDRLALLPQTEMSLRRIIEALPTAEPATQDSLHRVLGRIEFDLLKQQWDTLKASEVIPEGIRNHLQSRLDLANENAEPLWDRMLAFGHDLGEGDLTAEGELEINRIIEALARHPDQLRDRVMAALADSNIKDWAEMFVVDLAGEMRLTDAIGPILDRLKNDDADLLWDVSAEALAHIGNEQVVQQILERFGRDGAGFQISTAELLGRIKRPEAQAAILKLLAEQTDVGIVSILAAGLVELAPNDAEAFETLRSITRENRYDRANVHLDEELIRLSTMTGVELPEAEEWQTRIKDARSKWMMGMSNVDQLMQPAGSLGPSMLHALPPAPPLPPLRPVMRARRPAKPRSNRQPIRNAKVKVGRNDPCPCGSGKKHKKCCGR